MSTTTLHARSASISRPIDRHLRWGYLTRKLALAGMVLLIAVLVFGGCGEENDRECSHCCACGCAGGSCSGELEYIESKNCMVCRDSCQNLCAGKQCAVQTSRYCDNDPYCNCMCECSQCPLNETPEVATKCRGYDCPTCTMICRDTCREKGCQLVSEHYSTGASEGMNCG